jgi:hypothetical protein
MPIVPPHGAIDLLQHNRSWEADMQVIQGQVRRFLHGRAGEINAFILDRGIEVRFPSAQSTQVSRIVELASNVEIHGWTRPGPAGGMQFDATAIINSDSNQIVYLRQLPLPHEPEVPPSSTAMSEEAASLAPLLHDGQAQDTASGNSFDSIEGFTGEDEDRVLSYKSHPADGTGSHPTGVAVATRWANREGAVKNIERAYDDLHRTQAILAYVKIVDLKDPNVGQLLEEAKRCYEQAFSTYQRDDFTAAEELAAASSNLSATVELVVSRTFRSSANSPTLVPSPPLRRATSTESAQAQNYLLRVQKLLFRIRWLLENGTMPAEDIQEVQKITTWSETFCLQAQRVFRAGGTEDSMELAKTAYEIARAAEHICKKCYVTRDASSHFTVTAQPSD